MEERGPQLEFHEQEHGFDVDLERIALAGRSALQLALEAVGPGVGVLSDLRTVEITLVDDPTIASVHDEFMSIPGATDVITFEHGEIVISVDTAARQASEFQQSLDREIALYVIHGLLHLNGHRDKDPTEREVMTVAQEKILASVWAG